jgi:hypothetical protein
MDAMDLPPCGQATDDLYPEPGDLVLVADGGPRDGEATTLPASGHPPLMFAWPVPVIASPHDQGPPQMLFDYYESTGQALPGGELVYAWDGRRP